MVGYYILFSKVKNKTPNPDITIKKQKKKNQSSNTLFTNLSEIICKLVYMTENPTTMSDQTNFIITRGVVRFIC